MRLSNVYRHARTTAAGVGGLSVAGLQIYELFQGGELTAREAIIVAVAVAIGVWGTFARDAEPTTNNRTDSNATRPGRSSESTRAHAGAPHRSKP